MSYTVLDIETTGSLPWKDKLLAVGLGSKVYEPELGRKYARMALARPGATIVAHTNYDLRWLLLDGATLGEGVTFHDTKVMAWLLDGTQELSLAALAKKYLGLEPDKPIRQVAGKIMFECSLGLVPIEDVPWPEMQAYNASDIAVEAELYEVLRDEMKRAKIWHMFVREEAPFSRLLVEMESTGMPFDTTGAIVLLEDTQHKLAQLRDYLVEATGAIGFNPGSGDQVARFLYTELWKQPVRFEIPRLNGISLDEKLEKVKRLAPKGVVVERVGRDYAYGVQHLEGRGFPFPPEKHPGLRPTVSSKVLDVHYGSDPWVAAYIEWRRLDKLRGYLVDWVEREHDGFLHGRFDQSGTITGRLAAREPNLQQVAKESDVRTLFGGDSLLVVGDYAGLEARLGAHFSGDPVLLETFRAGEDLYGVLAARAWGGPPTKENENRNLMKVVWLASQYGAKGETLAQAMAQNGLRGWDAKAADTLLKEMMAAVPRLFEWRKEVIAQAKEEGYVVTLGGRARHLADINSADWQKSYRAERQAVNSLVQGSAADVVRRAMLVLRERIPLQVARICLQVHDEIILVTEHEFDEQWFRVVVELAEHGHGFELAVPLKFEARMAWSWGDVEPESGVNDED